MTLYEFNLLDKENQYILTFKEGTFIDHHIDSEKRFALYAVEKFFVEVEYDQKNNKITNLISFVEGNKLDQYSYLSK